VVVDDGSTDDTAAILHRYPDVVYVHQDNKGPSAARNAAVEHSSGEFVANFDSDDVLRRRESATRFAISWRIPRSAPCSGGRNG